MNCVVFETDSEGTSWEVRVTTPPSQFSRTAEGIGSHEPLLCGCAGIPVSLGREG